MNRRRCRLGSIGFVLLTVPWMVAADGDTDWQLDGSANLTVNAFRKTEQLNSQYELSFFINASRLENTGFGFGYIRQDQAISSRQNIVNDFIYLGGWQAWYADTLRGKFIASLDYYRGSESISGNNSRSPGRMRKPGFLTATIPFTDTLNTVNPSISFIPYSKNYYVDLSYARSSYDSDDPSISDLTVKQWAPAVAVLFNNQYDRLQLRHYAIELSDGDRTGGVDDSRGNEFKWTHWFQASASGPSSMHVGVLTGERLFAVDREARKIYNLTDMQTAAYSLGATWQLDQHSQVYVFGGLEEYTDLELNDDYTGLFVYLGIAHQW